MHLCGSYMVVKFYVCGKCVYVAYCDDTEVGLHVCMCVYFQILSGAWLFVIQGEGLTQTVLKQQGLCHAAKGCDSNSQLAMCGNTLRFGSAGCP